MRYQFEVLNKGENGDWQGENFENKIQFFGSGEEINLEIVGEKINNENSEGTLSVLVRDDKIVRLPKKTVGKIEEGDQIWLLDQKGGEEFLSGKRENLVGAVAKIEILTEKRNEGRDIYVKEPTHYEKKGKATFNVILGIIVLLLLTVATVLGYQKRVDGEQEKMFTTLNKSYQEKTEEIEKVRSINLETALSLAAETEKMLYDTKINDKKYLTNLEEMKEKIRKIKWTLGSTGVEYESIYETSLIKEGIKFERIVVLGQTAYLWGKDEGRVDTVNLSLKSTEKLISDEKIKEFKGIFSNGDKLYGIGSSSIWEIKREALTEKEIKNVGEIGEMVGWNGLIYVIDNSSQSIKKLTESGASNWLKDGEKLSETITGMAVDGDIWLLGKSGNIYRYSRGEKVKVELSFIPEGGENKSLVTSEEVDFLAYVWKESAVIIYGKDGKIWSKHNFDQIKIKDIGIDNKNRAVLVLADNGKIYRIKIK